MQVYTAIPLGAMENSNNSSSDEGFMSRVRSRNTDGKLKVLIGLLLVIVTLVIIVVSTQPHHHHHHSHHHKQQHKSLVQYHTQYPYSAHEESRMQKMMQQRENIVQSPGPRYLRSSPVVVVVTKSSPSSPRMVDMMSPSQQLMNAHSMNMSFESLFEHDMNSSIQSMMQMMNVMEQEMMRDFNHMNRVLDAVIGESPSVEDHFMRPCSMRMPQLVQVLNEPKVDADAVPVTTVTSNNGHVEEELKNAEQDVLKTKTETVDVVSEVEQEDTITTTTDNNPENIEFPDEDSLPDFNAEFPDEDSLPDFDGAEDHIMAVPELVSDLSAVEDLR